jgi:ATP synthase F1 delta subunit
MKSSTKIDAIVAGIISYLEENKALDLLPEIARRILEQSWFRHDPNLALVATPVTLSAQQKKQIAAILSRQLKRPIRVKNRVDRSIIAGMRVTVAGQEIDGTLNHQLKQLKNQIIYG